jgi:hypothetical protein
MASPSLNQLLGPLLVGSYANSVLYTLEIVAVIQYYSASKAHGRPGRDSVLLQAMIYLAFISDAVSTLAAYALFYLNAITHWGDIHYVLTEKHCVPGTAMLIANGISAAIVQCFMIYRYWKLSAFCLSISVSKLTGHLEAKINMSRRF